MTTEQIGKVGMAALDEALGADGAIRFLRQFTPGKGDYTAMRKKILGNPGVEAIVREIRDARARSEKPSAGEHPHAMKRRKAS